MDNFQSEGTYFWIIEACEKNTENPIPGKNFLLEGLEDEIVRLWFNIPKEEDAYGIYMIEKKHVKYLQNLKMLQWNNEELIWVETEHTIDLEEYSYTLEASFSP